MYRVYDVDVNVCSVDYNGKTYRLWYDSYLDEVHVYENGEKLSIDGRFVGLKKDGGWKVFCQSLEFARELKKEIDICEASGRIPYVERLLLEQEKKQKQIKTVKRTAGVLLLSGVLVGVSKLLDKNGKKS